MSVRGSERVRDAAAKPLREGAVRSGGAHRPRVETNADGLLDNERREVPALEQHILLAHDVEHGRERQGGVVAANRAAARVLLALDGAHDNLPLLLGRRVLGLVGLAHGAQEAR